ncbi:DNA mismatch endonuclease Vsr [Rhizobium leguminosarum bv. viciae 248]|uniref:very short patch repair endonuclease n=1 Tax=Rhizobium leguminosarum TaxID=384 RepID=UPI000371625B|nr:very short patch repair endonuclease [Rhizobium leguminosarum]MCA2405775.1 very short patch repair endonuclease [Rhizobium leguminosarum]NKM64951.1 DNA mismatch endonuclease Vsr [Rhizobium leguminosarum bv. viciae]QHW22963.1 DNA mismatch endonuclease Vsr [Rhizobium leguminosarum bv. viciae 248]
MTDPARSALMSKVKGKNTRPELIVRQELHALGGRFRLHRKDLPGRPDIVMPSRKLAVFVHGCFWHRHQNCRMASTPKTRQGFWNEKFDANIARDQRNAFDLQQLGWRVEVIWECQTRKREQLSASLKKLLVPPENHR